MGNRVREDGEEQRPYYDIGFGEDGLSRRARLACSKGIVPKMPGLARNPETGEVQVREIKHHRPGLTPSGR